MSLACPNPYPINQPRPQSFSVKKWVGPTQFLRERPHSSNSVENAAPFMVNPVVKVRPHRGIIYHPVQQRQQHIPIRLLLLRSTPSAGVGVGAICTNIHLSRFMRSAPRGFAIRFIFSGWSQPFPLFQVIEASTCLLCLLRQR